MPLCKVWLRRFGFQNWICHCGKVRIDVLEIRQHIEVNCAGLKRFRQSCVKPTEMTVAEFAFTLVDKMLVTEKFLGKDAILARKRGNRDLEILPHLLEKLIQLDPAFL